MKQHACPPFPGRPQPVSPHARRRSGLASARSVCRVMLTIWLVMLSGLLPSVAGACTRILWNSGRTGVLAGRTMDWPASTDPVLLIFPRGLHRSGGVPWDPHFVVNPAIWTSDYASLVTSMYGIGTVDGMNEKGLGAHLLYLNSTVFEPRNPAIPGLQAGLWAQYVLDKAATVSEALEILKKIQVVMISARGHRAAVHLVLDDAGGDSAVVEYLHGIMHIHHGQAWTVVTNDPDYDTQLSQFTKKAVSPSGCELSLPGNMSSEARFARATCFSHLLKTPETPDSAVVKLLSVMSNVSVPYDASSAGDPLSATEYRTLMDLTRRRYIFDLTSRLQVQNIDLMTFPLQKGAPVMRLDPRHPARGFAAVPRQPY